MIKVYVEDGSTAWVDALTCNMWERNGYLITEDIEEADIVCFTGGADVDPALYGEQNLSSYTSSARDMLSLQTYTRAERANNPLLVGICRGGQFLNVMKGGLMIQHMDGHMTDHTLKGYEDRGLFVSDHHQVMVPNVGTSYLGCITDTEGNVEVVKYDNTLCYQPHPEYEAGSPSEVLFFELVEEMK